MSEMETESGTDFLAPDLPIEAPEADAIEQSLPVADEDDEDAYR